jgi:NAD(P)-dependent dehydrogenase (short-subunit alcohol dehydrogenase family)
MDAYDLSGKIAVVTGAGSGIGRASAELLAKRGAQIVAVGRGSGNINETVRELGGSEKGHVAIEADVSSEADMKNAYKEVIDRWPYVDIVVINAGVNGVWAPLDKIAVSEWDETISINLRGTFLTLKYALPLLRARGGSVVIVSSVNGTRIFSNTGATAYSCSKAAQVAFAKMTALELAREKIRVNVICPGAIGTSISESTELRDIRGGPRKSDQWLSYRFCRNREGGIQGKKTR